MRKSTKQLAALGVAAVTIASTGVAYAYWTTTGSGTGSATSTTSVAADAIQLAQGGSLTGFYPGGAAQNVVVKATNPALYSQKVGNVTVTVADSGTCLSTNWTVVDSADAFGILTAGASSAAAGQTVATVALAETGANQDVCKS